MVLVAIGAGAAVLEIQRALNNNGGNGDVEELREREAALRKQLQVSEGMGLPPESTEPRLSPTVGAVPLDAWRPSCITLVSQFSLYIDNASPSSRL